MSIACRCLDIAFPETHAVIGDRAYADRPEPVAALGRAAAEGLLAEGVMPVIKHIPGHGRADGRQPSRPADGDARRATCWSAPISCRSSSCPTCRGP